MPHYIIYYMGGHGNVDSTYQTLIIFIDNGSRDGLFVMQWYTNVYQRIAQHGSVRCGAHSGIHIYRRERERSSPVLCFRVATLQIGEGYFHMVISVALLFSQHLALNMCIYRMCRKSPK